jgi:dTDP-4-dehydrorhamnose reductase
MHARAKYLLTGGSGQLAQAFRETFERLSLDYRIPAENDLDICDERAVDRHLSDFRPDVIINCAAYNLVDRAEQERDICFRVNAKAPQTLARLATTYRAKLVHFSSDYVFDGQKEHDLYHERDITAPLNQYGKSKLLGEQWVQEAGSEHLVLRVSWLYGRGQQNFIEKLLQWARVQEFLKIAYDEFSVPTSAVTAVEVTLKAIEQNIHGLYHLTNSGYCSRYEWARLVLVTLGIRKFVRPVSMEIYHLPAKRPNFSAMSNAQIARVLGIDIPSWQDGVQLFLRETRR